MQFLKTYRKVRKVFRRPKLHLFIGRWRNYPGLPVWRVGNHIRLWKEYNDYTTVFDEHRYVRYEWTDHGRKNRPLISRLFPPTITLPLWLTFRFFDEDIHWKTKWTNQDIRYEYPAQLCLVFFGLCVSVWASIPKMEHTDQLDESDYWETILKYIHCYNESLEETASNCGWWRDINGPCKPQFSPEYLKDPLDRSLVKAINIEKKLLQTES